MRRNNARNLPPTPCSLRIAQLIACFLGAYILFVVLVINRSDFLFKADPVRSDLRSLSTALEAYMIDNDTYPRTLHLLTTPDTYIAAIPPDPFGPTTGWRKHVPFAYHRHVPDDADPHGMGWILWSRGPDEDYDLNPGNIAKVYDTPTSQPTLLLITQFTYDSTNGSKSDGDVWRVHGQ